MPSRIHKAILPQMVHPIPKQQRLELSILLLTPRLATCLTYMKFASFFKTSPPFSQCDITISARLSESEGALS